ncbi:MAG: insulinase family protein [Spirochaetes bacterium]|nr:insulinase family protein [Spirochaetota bacterium]
MRFWTGLTIGFLLLVRAGEGTQLSAYGVREVREPNIEELSPRSDAPLPKDPLLVQGKLPNGLSYYIRRNIKPENRAELRLVVNAGSVLEEEDQQGLAHFVEHMAFKGTARFPKNSLVNWLESIGMRFGPETNAYTSFDETVYQLEVPLEDPKILDTALSILFDWAFGLTLAAEEIEKERGVILEEWRLGRGASSRVRDKQYPVLWNGSRYAERLPIGKPEVIRGSPPEALRRFYTQWYRPDLMAIVAVGDFHPADVERRIQETFGVTNPGKNPPFENRVRPVFMVPDHPQTFVSIATDPELPYSSVGIYLKQDPTIPRTFAEYRQELVKDLFFSILNTRFSEGSRKPGAPFLFAGAGSAHPIRSKQLLYLSASAEEGGIVRALEGILTEVRRIQLYGVSVEEVERAKAEISRQAEQRAREQHTLSSSVFVRSYVDAYLRGTPTLGPEYAFRLIRHLLKDISPSEVGSLAPRFLEPANRVILVSAPEKERSRLPSEEELLAQVDKVAKSTPPAYQEETAITNLLEPGSLAGSGDGTLERVIGSISDRYGAVEWKLGNGARVVLKPTEFKADEILFSAFSLGGTSLVEDGDVLSATFAPDVVEQSGLGSFSSTQIEKYLSGKLISLSPSIDEVAFRFNGSSSKKDLETFFQLLYLYFTSPRYDEPAVLRYMDQVRTSLRNRENSPEERYTRLIQETLKGGHPRSLPLTVERLSQIDPKKAYSLYRAFVSRPDTFTFVFVGSVKPEELEPYLRRYLSSIPLYRKGPATEVTQTGGSPDRVAASVPAQPEADPAIQRVVERLGSIMDRGVRFLGESVQKTLRAGKEPKSLVTLYVTGTWDWSLEEMSYLNLLEDYLDLRLREVIREDKGGTYGVNVSITPRRAPVPEYSIEISFGTAPTRVQELVSLLQEELDRLKTTPPSESDVAKVREQRLRLVERGRKENGFWRYFLSQELYYGAVDQAQGRGPAVRSQVPLQGTLFDLWEQTARRVTPRMLQERIRNYFVESRMLRFTLEPEDSTPQ